MQPSGSDHFVYSKNVKYSFAPKKATRDALEPIKAITNAFTWETVATDAIILRKLRETEPLTFLNWLWALME